jgi:Tol biopolymer transport system component
MASSPPSTSHPFNICDLLMITDSHNQQLLWLTDGICNMVNDSTEQGGRWSVGGRYLAITCNQDQNSDIVYTSILDTQTGKVQSVPLRETITDSWSPIARYLLIRHANLDGDGVDWYVVDARTRKITKLTTLSDQNSAAVWSPDGTRVAITGYSVGQPNAVAI